MQQRPRRNPFRTSLGPLYLLDACCFLSSFAIWKIDDFIDLQQFTAFKPLAHRPKPMLAKP